MSRTIAAVLLAAFLLVLLVFTAQPAGIFYTQESKPQQPSEKDRGLGIQPTATPTPGAPQINTSGNKPEIVLQAGITSPQTQISFSPDGRLLASMGMFGNSIKIWEVTTGRLLRQLESSIPTMGASSLSRPFHFSRDGKTITAITEGRVRRWDVETGRELNNTLLSISRDFFYAFLSDDSQTVAVLKMDNSAIKVLDTASGRELYSAGFAQDEQILDQDSFALSGDGKLLAVLTETVKASMKGADTRLQVALWDIVRSRKIQTIKVSSKQMQLGASTRPAGSVMFGPDGTTLAIRNEDTVKLWDVNTGQEVKTINSPTLSPTRTDRLAVFMSKFTFSPNRQFISVLGDGDKINIVDVSTGNPAHILPGHAGRVVGLSFSTDGHLLASSGTDNQIKLWDVPSGREVRSLSGSAMPISDLAFSTDGKSLMLAGNQAVSSWELGTGGVRRAVTIPQNYGSASEDNLMQRHVVLSRDGRFLIAGDKDSSTAKVWETATGKEAQSIALDPQKQMSSATFSRNGSIVILADGDKPKPKSAASTASASQTPVGQPDAMVMPDMSKIMEQMRKDPKKAQEQMKKVQEAMAQGDLSAGMNMMESMGMIPTANKANKTPNSLRVVELASGRQLHTIPLPSGFLSEITSNSFMSSSVLSVSPDQQTLASATGFAGPAILRDLKSGQEIRSLKAANTLTTTAIAWSADGKRLATAHYGFARNITGPNAAQFTFEDLTFSIKIWDPQTGNEIGSLPGHGNFVGSLVFSPDGRFLASGSFDSTVKIWDLATSKELATLKGHSGSITALDFSPDGQFIVSGSDDGSSRLWLTQTGALMATMVSLNQGSDWLVVTPDGLFDGSPGGWNQILWRFTPALYDVSPVEIFFNEYFRPGLLADILAGKKLTAAVDISRKDRRQPKLAVELVDQQNPAADVSTRTVKLGIRVTEAPSGAQDLRLFRNGSLVKAWRGDVLGGQAAVTLETPVSIVAGQNKFTAYAFNHDNVKSSDATLSLVGAAALKRAATLHLLVVGLNKYANSAYDLKYAAADARAFGEEVERQQEKLGRFQHIEVTTLIDQEATKANLLYALKRLSREETTPPPQGSPAALERIKSAEPEDAVIVYFAGHGTAQDQRFYLIPHDLGYQGTRTGLDRAGLQTILEHSVSDLELEQAFTGIDAGLAVMVIDACNSGQALEAEEKRRGPMNSKGLAQLAYEKGMYILTAAQSYQAALEAEQLGHGYLTFALVEEGLKTGAADNQPHDNQVLLREWLDYATERVPRMQEAKMRETRGVGLGLAFVEGEQKVVDVDKRTLQRPRVFYRREEETEPLVVAKP